jgi:hypothetical protein
MGATSVPRGAQMNPAPPSGPGERRYLEIFHVLCLVRPRRKTFSSFLWSRRLESIAPGSVIPYVLRVNQVIGTLFI